MPDARLLMVLFQRDARCFAQHGSLYNWYRNAFSAVRHTGICGGRKHFLCGLASIAARAFSLSLHSRLYKPLMNPAPSRRELRFMPLLVHFSVTRSVCCKEGGQRLPPGGSWIREWMEHPRAKTEGERASCIQVMLHSARHRPSKSQFVNDRPSSFLPFQLLLWQFLYKREARKRWHQNLPLGGKVARRKP